MKISDLKLDAQIEAASAYQALKASRQIAYQLAKTEPAYRALAEETDALYLRWCGEFGVKPEAIFDRDEYEKSERYQAILRGDIR